MVLGTRRARRRHARDQAVPDVRGRHPAAARRRRRAVASRRARSRRCATISRQRRDQLCAGLVAARPRAAGAGGHVLRQRRRRRGRDRRSAPRLPERCGVVAIPMAAFYDHKDAASTFVRFAFCKRGEVIAEAARQLASLSCSCPPLRDGESSNAIVSRSWSVARRRMRETCICDTPICFAISLWVIPWLRRSSSTSRSVSSQSLHCSGQAAGRVDERVALVLSSDHVVLRRRLLRRRVGLQRRIQRGRVAGGDRLERFKDRLRVQLKVLGNLDDGRRAARSRAQLLLCCLHP